MGTRSIISFILKDLDGNESVLTEIFQQNDGYLEGVGRSLCEWLLTKKIINGIGINQYTDEYANGYGDLAAQYVRDFKERGPGNLYITSSYDKDWIDYNYEVVCDLKDYSFLSEGTPANNVITIRVNNFGEKPFFVGTPRELLEYKEPDE